MVSDQGVHRSIGRTIRDSGQGGQPRGDAAVPEQAMAMARAADKGASWDKAQWHGLHAGSAVWRGGGYRQRHGGWPREVEVGVGGTTADCGERRRLRPEFCKGQWHGLAAQGDKAARWFWLALEMALYGKPWPEFSHQPPRQINFCGAQLG